MHRDSPLNCLIYTSSRLFASSAFLPFLFAFPSFYHFPRLILIRFPLAWVVCSTEGEGGFLPRPLPLDPLVPRLCPRYSFISTLQSFLHKEIGKGMRSLYFLSAFSRFSLSFYNSSSLACCIRLQPFFAIESDEKKYQNRALCKMASKMDQLMATSIFQWITMIILSVLKRNFTRFFELRRFSKFYFISIPFDQEFIPLNLFFFSQSKNIDLSVEVFHEPGHIGIIKLIETSSLFKQARIFHFFKRYRTLRQSTPSEPLPWLCTSLESVSCAVTSRISTTCPWQQGCKI